MAGNPISLVSALAEEVADTLRHDNLDTRIHQWIGLAFNDMVDRSPIELFQEATVVTVADGDSSVAFTTDITTPMGATFVDANSKLYVASYVSSTDFSRLTAIGAAITASTMPLYWTIKQDGTTQKLFISPPASGAIVATVFWAGKYLSTSPGGSDKLDLPYHFEHVLVWGAAALGAMAVRPSLHPLFQAEYEQALGDMQQIVSYHPDATPVRRSITGVHAGSRKMQAPPRFPQNIS